MAEAEEIPTNIDAPTNINSNPIYVQVRDKLEVWKSLIDSNFAVSLITSGVKLKFKNPSASRGLLKKKINQRFMSVSNKLLLKPEIDTLLDLGILSCCEVSNFSRYYENYIFPRVKPNGKVRIIFDMKSLNQKLSFKTFKNMKLSDLYPYFHDNSYACRLDLSNAYYHLGIADSCKKFLAFNFDNKIYTWNAMPFGLSEAPYLFSKVMECIITNLRIRYNLIIMFYLDDILILEKSYEACKMAIQLAIQFISSLGMSINYEKSISDPVQVITFLGVTLDLVNKTMSPSSDNIEKCIQRSISFRNRVKANRKAFKSLIGTLNFSAHYTWTGRNEIKYLTSYLSLFRDLHWKVIPASLKSKLQVWTTVTHYGEIPIPKSYPDVVLFTDASSKGWGALFVIGDRSVPVRGEWSQEERSLTMNSLETLAILKAFQVIPQHLRNVNVHILSDNTTAVSSVNRLGSTKFPARQQILTKLVAILRKKVISVSIAHLAGSLNVSADALSRNVSSLPSEATLSKEKFAQLCSKAGILPEVDLFGSPWNKKCPLFTPFNHSLTFQVADSLLTDWSNLKTAYAFPPPSALFPGPFSNG